MLLLGLVILILGVLGLVLSYFGASIDYNHRSAEILNWDVAPRTLVLWGAICMLLSVLGMWLVKGGMKQGWKRRKEHKRLAELSEKLDEADFDRRDRRDDGDS